MTMIVAISAPPGGGKTALIDVLRSQLPDTSVIAYDDYQAVTTKPMVEVIEWLERGGTLDFMDVPLLAEHLACLKTGQAVCNPSTGVWVKPAPVIFFETPLGRAHHATGQFIDVLFWLEVPLDLALARKVQSFTHEFLCTSSRQGLAENVQWLSQYLANYQQGTHRALMLQRERVRANQVDYILDGTEPLPVLAQQLVERLGQTT